MKNNGILLKEITKKVLCIILLITIALLSAFVISKPATSPESYSKTISSIDEKKATVMGISATAAAAATALALIPDDATTPIANQIMEISSYLFIVVCVLVLEKSLITVFGFISCNILIPLACGLLGIYTFLKKESLKIIAIKFIVFALLLVHVIPISFKLGDLIYEANKTTIEQVAEESDTSNTTAEKSPWWKNIFKKAKEFTSELMEKAKQTLNKFIDAIAIFIIAYCTIPVLVIFFMLWFFKVLFGITINVPKVKGFKPFKNKNDNVEIIEV